ncbi:hypothetical protein BSG1_13211 [Bacillus sp. SG-1]|nr:hypothetical protein BSG1_13211 [Bacillus sp. SG-1]
MFVLLKRNPADYIELIMKKKKFVQAQMIMAYIVQWG